MLWAVSSNAISSLWEVIDKREDNLHNDSYLKFPFAKSRICLRSKYCCTHIPLLLEVRICAHLSHLNAARERLYYQ